MAYNNNYQSYNKTRKGSNYQKSNGGYQKPKKKHSGAFCKQVLNSRERSILMVSAWNYSKEKGLIKVVAFENSRSTRTTGEKMGNDHITLMFEITYLKTGNRLLELASYNITTGKVMLNKIGMVVSTKAPNGGYFGGISKRR